MNRYTTIIIASALFAFGTLVAVNAQIEEQAVQLPETTIPNFIGDKKTEDKIDLVIASSSNLFDDKEALKIVMEQEKQDEIIKLLKQIVGLLKHQNNVLLK